MSAPYDWMVKAAAEVVREGFCRTCGVELVRKRGERAHHFAKRQTCSRAHRYGSEAQRFAAKYTVNPETGCWEWTSTRSTEGYGRFALSGSRRQVQAHRFSLELAGVEIPDDMVVDHLCRVRNCVNPEHLDVVTERENLLRGMGWSGTNYRKTHCPHGHRYTDENTRIWKKRDGKEQRFCRACHRESERRRRVARRAA